MYVCMYVMLWVSLTAMVLSGNNSGQVVYTRASATNRRDLVLLTKVMLCVWEGNCRPGRK